MNREEILKNVGIILKYWKPPVQYENDPVINFEYKNLNALLELYNTDREVIEFQEKQLDDYIKENNKLKENIKEYKIQEDLTFKCLDKTKYMSNFISKDKIKAKIEELKNDDENYYWNQINILELILEEEEEIEEDK